ncbi:hypothetical protein, partial [Staphylococcus aureus]|uniref:hypothetical protein n=1 Tax=Staphylococcus aureus TaxID=1280 RepID=UPI003D118372
WKRIGIGLRFLICGIAILTFDQAGFYMALNALNGAPAEVFWGGWLAKMGAALFYAGVLTIYLRFFSQEPRAALRQPIGDIFNTLT